MKKKSLKKIFAGLLSAAMFMSSVSAFSVTEDTTHTIDTSKDVSFTIHKYDYTSSGGTEINGTGSVNDSVPAGAKGLNDVEFTVYKIADIEQTTASGSISIKYKTLSDLTDAGVDEYIEGGMTEATVKSTFIENSAVKDVLDGRTSNKSVKKTITVDGNDGVAKFTKDDLFGQGLYLVVETDKPAKVTSVMAPFLVSLPTTIQNGDTSGWLYDVYAFPKNSTQTSAITIKKEGKVPNEAGTTGITGAKFYLQMQVSGNWVTQTENANGGLIGDSGLITVNDIGGYVINELAPGNYRFVEVSAPSEYIAESDVYHTFSIDSDGKVTINGEEKTTLTVVNEKPTIEKEVLKKDGDMSVSDDWSHNADYSTGDTVNYKVTVTVPKNIDKLSTFKIVDTFDADKFTVDPSGFEYKFYTGEGTLTENSAVTEPTNSATVTETGWSLDLTPDKSVLKANNITTIDITFKVTLKDSAITAGDGNKNTASLEFTNHIYADKLTDPDNPVEPEGDVKEETTTIEDKAVVYTFGLELNKTFVGSSDASLKATFTLYVADKNGSEKIKVNGSDVKVTKIEDYEVTNGTPLKVNTADGNKGLANGTYYLVETKTAGGYNLLKEPVKVEIKKYYTTTFKTIKTVTKYDSEGNVIGTPVTETIGEDKVTYYSDDAKSDEISDTTTSVKVENRKGFSFPVTGGKGTVIFTVAGLALMILAVIVFSKSRKKSRA